MNTPIAPQLLPWFAKYGRHNLPWQGRNLYHIWLSEVMLQQTQVGTVISYFNHFSTQFPTIIHLANATEDEVMQAWAGLGYYARARNLHKAAKIICDNYQGYFPKQFTQILALPGVGRSTAGAILALGLNQHYAILDGNVKRILSRYHHIKTAIDRPATINTLWHYAQVHTPQHKTKEYTQAVMDLGATICTKTQPKCPLCPLQKSCLAYRNKTQYQLPIKSKAKPKPTKTTMMLVIINNGKVLLQKRPSYGIWGGLWSLLECPDIKSTKPYTVAKKPQILPTFRHTFSHYHLDITPCIIYQKSISPSADFGQCGWFSIDNIPVGIPKPVQTILSKIPVNETH